MDKRFLIKKVYICNFKVLDTVGVIPELEKYPMRICVIDKDQGIAIDIEHGLQYEYLETVSRLYFVNCVIGKIKPTERFAIFPDSVTLNDEIKEVAYNIIKRLKNGEIFPNGNEFFNNEEYLKKLQEESISQKSAIKSLKIKRKKVK